jgi:Fe-S cluster assembly iron-binding protein IscA
MMPEPFLAHCRTRLDRYRRSVLARVGWWRIWPRTTANQTPLVAQAYRNLIDKGQVVWGAVVQANEALLSPGPYDLPGNVLFSPASDFDERPADLSEIASRVRGLRGRAAELAGDLELQAIAATISDELNLVVNRRLPPRLTGGHEVYLTWLTIHRDSLPGGILAGQLLPLLICPPATEMAIVLPLELWPAGRNTTWDRLAGLQRSAYGNPAPADRAAPPVFPRQPTPADVLAARPAATDFPAEGVAITPAAAAVFRPILERQAVEKGQAFLYVAIRDGRERLEVAEQFDAERQVCIRCEGIDILIEREQLPLLRGALIDFATSPYESGFKFLWLDSADGGSARAF